MNIQNLDARAVLSYLVVVAAFVVIGIYVFENRPIEAVVAAILSSSVSGVLSFYFGTKNGATTAMMAATTALANRAGPTVPANDPNAPTAAPAPPPAPAPSPPPSAQLGAEVQYRGGRATPNAYLLPVGTRTLDGRWEWNGAEWVALPVPLA
jgi:hypothetical protein